MGNILIRNIKLGTMFIGFSDDLELQNLRTEMKEEREMKEL